MLLPGVMGVRVTLILMHSESNRRGVLGGDRFKDEIEAALARRVKADKAGRPGVTQGHKYSEVGVKALMLL
jgi:hypothetical protein